MILIPHEKRTLWEKISFVTSPGYIHGSDDRKEAGLKAGGPSRVITDLAILGFHHGSKMMQLESVYQDVSVREIERNTGFELIIPKKLPTTEPPTVEQLMLLRSRIDPHGFYTKAPFFLTP